MKTTTQARTTPASGDRPACARSARPRGGGRPAAGGAWRGVVGALIARFRSWDVGPAAVPRRWPVPVGRGGHDVLLGGLGAVEDRGDPSAVHHRDPVADPQQFLEFGGGREHGHAGLGGAVDQLVDLGFRADVDAAGGLVEQEQLGAAANARPKIARCWLPPDREPIGWSTDCIRTLTLVVIACASARSRRGPSSPRRDPAQDRDGDVVLDRGEQDQGLLFAVLRDHRDPGRGAVAGAARGVGRAGQGIVPPVARLRPGDRVDQPAAAGAHQPGDAEDLALAHVRSTGPRPSAVRPSISSSTGASAAVRSSARCATSAPTISRISRSSVASAGVRSATSGRCAARGPGRRSRGPRRAGGR